MGLLESRRTMVRTVLALGVVPAVNLVLTGLVLIGFEETGAGWAAIGGGLAYALAIPYFAVTGNNVRSSAFVLIVSYINNVVVHVLLGGYSNSGGYMAWGIIVCAFAVIIQSKRFTITITGFYVVTAVVLVFLESSLSDGRLDPDPLVPAILAADFFVISLLMLVPGLSQLLGLLAAERARSESLLLNVLPPSIATRLKAESGVIAEAYDQCTVLFADIAGFTAHSRNVSAEALVEELNGIFSAFDALVDGAGLEKIKTLGDGYMVVAGAPVFRPDHVTAACDLGLAMIDTMGAIASDLNIRIGINTGPAVGGVIGTSKFSYDLWGDTVNLASRMESFGVVGEVQVTQEVVDSAGDRYSFESVGTKDLKGEGPTQAYLLRRGDSGKKSSASTATA
ncbi:MAG: adenylate/guanylate cyclase domain-containing protein [bacterium]|nr:adenylate/guanylate cyclase domain-containing protein [bacterium]